MKMGLGDQDTACVYEVLRKTILKSSLTDQGIRDPPLHGNQHRIRTASKLFQGLLQRDFKA